MRSVQGNDNWNEWLRFLLLTCFTEVIFHIVYSVVPSDEENLDNQQQIAIFAKWLDIVFSLDSAKIGLI